MRKSIYTFLLPAYAWSLAVVCFAQNCPAILQCPNSLQTICDPTENDSTLWNEPPYTWSPLLETADLYEGIVDLGLRAVVCHNGGQVSVSYKIFLDLDSDFLAETVINSNQLPPPGIIFANNGQNPGNIGGDTLWFDKRPVPASSRFAFTMESHVGNDTLTAHVRWNTPDNAQQFLMPRLPEGKHGILWTVTQDGVTRTCQYSFRVTDCAPPVLVCGGSRVDDIGPDRIYPITASDLIDFVADNITATDELEISLRNSGTGTGFPTAGGQPIPDITLDCSSLGANLVQVWARDQHGNIANCAVSITLNDSVFICTELPRVCARTYWDSTLVIDDVETKITWENPAETVWTYLLPHAPDGCNTLDSFPPYPFAVTERSFSDPLNGVTTFDLLLISRHILSIEALDAPWKIIAADANSSGSVTTNDVVQLRRLILGITTDLPEGKSWRFFTDNCQFPPNPFEVTNCSTGYEFDPMPFWAYPEEIRFYGLKTGDVNNSALANSAQVAAAYRSSVNLEVTERTLQAGEIADIPVNMEQAGDWSGFQCSLPFDPQKVEIMDVTVGESLTPREFAFAQPLPGDLRVSWFDVQPRVLLPGENLLTLRVKALKNIQLSDALAIRETQPAHSLASEIYTAEGETQQLQWTFRNAEKEDRAAQVFDPQPNPTSAGVRIPVRLETAETIRVSIGTLEGKQLYSNELYLSQGAQLLEVPASAFPESGVYTWQVQVGGKVYRGKVVRM